MAAKDRGPAPSVIARVHAEPERFAFVQAVRLIELAQCRAHDQRSEPACPIGEDAPPKDEAIRFRAAPALRFPAAEIAKVEAPAEGAGPTTLIVNFMGLTGPSGALPRLYTEYIVRNLRDRQTAMRDFFDVFNHRMVSLFYRAATKYRLPLAFERAGPKTDDPISKVFDALIGLGTPHLKGRLPVDDQALAYYAGHFARQPRSASVLEQMLSDFFGQKVGVKQFRGQWLRIAVPDQTRLPGADVADGQYNHLGASAVIGSRTWDMQGGFRITIGPLSYEAFRSFMPGGQGYHQLVGLTRAYAGPGLDFDVQVTLAREQVPYLRLGSNLTSGREPRLGWNTWLRREDEPVDRDEAVFGGGEGI